MHQSYSQNYSLHNKILKNAIKVQNIKSVLIHFFFFFFVKKVG